MSPPYAVVFFDCDSTLSAVEGIDELAREAGAYDELAEMTRRAMEGEIPLEHVYGLRLERIRPSRASLERLGALYVQRTVEDAADVIAALRAVGKSVHVVSGGLRQAVRVLGRHVGLPEENIHAVNLRFDDEGTYAGFDDGSPLTRTGGKAVTCGRVLAAEGGRGVIVGDGKTDLEARPPCAAVIGFGGVIARSIVKEGADAWVETPSLAPSLLHLIDRREATRLRVLGHAVVDRAQALQEKTT